VNRLVLRDVPKVALGYDAFELTLAGGFRGLRGVPPGFHRVELATGGRRVVLDVVFDRGDAVAAYALRGDRFVPSPSPLDAAAQAGDLDHALFDVSALPAPPAEAWRTLSSQLIRADDALAWRALAPDAPTTWREPRVIVALQGAWLAMNHDEDADAARWLAGLLAHAATADREVIARHPASFAALLDALGAIGVLGGERARELLADLRPLIAVCLAAPAPVGPAAARLAARVT